MYIYYLLLSYNIYFNLFFHTIKRLLVYIDYRDVYNHVIILLLHIDYLFLLK